MEFKLATTPVMPMAMYGACDYCEAVVRVSNFDTHRNFHVQAGTKDPGPHGYSELGAVESIQY